MSDTSPLEYEARDSETWKPIPGMNRYEVSSLGQVRSLWFRNMGYGNNSGC